MKGPDMNALQMVLGRHGSNLQAAPAVNTTNTQGNVYTYIYTYPNIGTIVYLYEYAYLFRSLCVQIC